MNICFLVPTVAYLDQAGARIRYKRIETSMIELGHTIHLVPLQELAAADRFDHDVYIISKCYDVRALLLARLIRGSGKLLGVDLFDDYFSQMADSRLTRFRLWLNELRQSANFILCSTPAMQVLATNLSPGTATHLLNDPSPPVDPDIICQSVKTRLDRAHDRKRINIAWFGIGDNPYFSVGLHDIADFGGVLARLRGHGYDVHLTILTNKRAMTPEVLAMLRRLAVPYTLDEWTIAKEDLLLADSLIAYLPVSAQGFSIVKSLNRAVTALVAGVQVLSNAYPLYEKLMPLIYTDAEALLADLEGRQLALRPDTVSTLVGLLRQIADPTVESARFAGFLEQQLSAQKQQEHMLMPVQMPPAAIVHGRKSSIAIHEFARQTGALSVAGPFCEMDGDFDMRFKYDPSAQKLAVYLSESISAHLPADQRQFAGQRTNFQGVEYLRLDSAIFNTRVSLDAAILHPVNSPISYTAAYGPVLNKIEMIMQILFPGIRCLASELNNLPAWPVNTRTPEPEIP